MEIMQQYDETLQDPKATSLIFVDKIFGQTCKFEGTPDDKKGAKIWMKDVMAKLYGNATEEAEPAKTKETEQVQETKEETESTNEKTETSTEETEVKEDETKPTEETQSASEQETSDSTETSS